MQDKGNQARFTDWPELIPQNSNVTCPSCDSLDEALKALSRLKHGPEALADALLQAESPDRAWALARVRMPFASGLEFLFWTSFMLPSLFTTIGWMMVLDPDLGLLNVGIRQWFPGISTGSIAITAPTELWGAGVRLRAATGAHVEVAGLSRSGPLQEQLFARGINCTALGARGGICGLDEIRALIARAERRSHSEFAARAIPAVSRG